jgi:serine protease
VTTSRHRTSTLSRLALGLAIVSASSAALAGSVTNPYSPRYGHEYRHGVIPTRAVQEAMMQWSLAHAPIKGAATNARTLSYGGGTGGVGVMSGQNKVYLVFYGTQWGTQTTDANGNLKFSNDAAGAAGAAQQMFKGIGTNGETWQNELTQWCNGAASGATSCAAGLTRIPRQTNILAGVWYDNASASPSAATGTQLAQEAIRAAAHFGNTATGSNRSTYYVILSPKGTNPDNYQGQYCAWHDYTGDGYGVTAPGGDLAFSNQPYNIDSGAGCGVNFVNSGTAGTLDGYTMTLGHEWHEMMSDQFPAGGWTNHDTGTYAGQENSDECAWIAAGSTGGAANIAFSTGTFAEQASWSNDTNSCAISHADVSGGGGNTAPVANWTYSANGLAVTFTDTSTDAENNISTHSWTFGDGGSSTATSPSHTYAANGTYSVTETVTDSGNLSSSKTVSISVSSGGGGGTVLSNGVPVTGLSATTGNYTATYTMVVPAGATNLKFVTSGSNGDADLYVKFGAAPTDTVYDCRPYTSSPSETCTFATPSAGTYYVRVKAYSSFTGLSLTGSFSTGGGGCGGTVLCSGTAVALPSVATGSWSSTYTMPITAGHTVTFTLSGGTGDADMYVKAGSAPTTTSYNCRPYVAGNSETCTFTPSANTTYYIAVRAYSAYSGVSLKGTSN